MRTVSLPLAAAVLAGCLQGALACGFHPGLASNTFDVVHPRSLGVAVAVARATRSGQLRVPEKPALPTFVGSDYRQAVDELRALQDRLDRAATAGGGTVDFALVFVGPRLWTTYHVRPDGAGAEIHVAASGIDQLVVLTDETVLAALLAGGLDYDAAVDQGLLVVTNDPDGRASGALRQALLVRTAPAALAN